MKLLNHDTNDSLVDMIVNDDIKRELNYTSNELKLIFDLNPCPISITNLEDGRIMDVNDSFIDIIGFNNKNDVMGKPVMDFNIVSDKDFDIVMKRIKKDGVLKNYFCGFKTKDGKKKKGLFSGYVMNFNDISYLVLICQVINKGFLSDIFKTYIFL